jgi:F-type H+-transporting ATPase subunit delta
LCQVFYNNADVRQVDVPSYSGNFGILANHVPSLAVIKPGVVTVYENEGPAKKYFVSSGTIAINDDSSVQVLAEEAVPVDWIDANAARKLLADAQANAGKGSTEQEKAEAAIALEVSEALVKAVE